MSHFEDELFRSAELTCQRSKEQAHLACVKLSLLSVSDKLLGITGTAPWRRGGAESFVCSATLVYEPADRREICRLKVIAKAYAGFGLGVDPADRVLQWFARARAIMAAGCGIAKVFSASRGVLFCKFIDHSLRDFMQGGSTCRKDWLRKELAEIGSCLDQLRVKPVCLLRDLRTDGDSIFLVDFGEDLGEVPGRSDDKRFCESLLFREAEQAGWL